MEGQLLTIVNQQLGVISQELTASLKSIIAQKGLRDSGSLINSIKAKVFMSNGNLEINIEAEDYYKYLDDRYSLTSTLVTAEFYRNVEERIASAIQQYINDKV
jgi:hypothetical protein